MTSLDTTSEQPTLLANISRRLGCTEGQLYTLVTGSVLAALVCISAPATTLTPAAAGPPPPGSGAPPVVTVPTPQATTGSPAPVSIGGLTPLDQLPAASPTTGALPVPTAPPTQASLTGPAVFARIGSPGVPGALTVSADGQVFVGSDNGSGRGVQGPSVVLEFDRAGRSLDSTPITGQPSNHTNGVIALAVSPRDQAVYVLDAASDRILRLSAATRIQTTVATVPDLTPCVRTADVAPCEPGALDHLPLPSALAFDAAGNLFISDAGQATIFRLRPGAHQLDDWYSSLDLATGDGPAGLAVDSKGALRFAAGQTLELGQLPQSGALYSLSRDANGAPGTRLRLASFSSTERPGAIALDTSDNCYLVLRGPATVVKVASGSPTAFPTTGAPIPVDAPAALAVAEDRLLIANASEKPSGWAVLSFPLN